jgi:hypothetical protein
MSHRTDAWFAWSVWALTAPTSILTLFRMALEAHSLKLRNEMDLEALNDELVGMVRETMQPAHVSLWLHPIPLQRTSNLASSRRRSHGLYRLHIINIIHPWLGAITALDDPIVRGRPRRSRRL